MSSDHPPSPPSPWIERFADRVRAGGHILDLACGSGRHTRLFLRHGHPVTAVDRNLDRVADLVGEPAATLVAADLEADDWPLVDRRYDAVVVCNYLHRPALAHVLAAVAPGGTLLYETFAVGHEHLGRPRSPAFLLRPNELLEWVRDGFVVHAYEHGRLDMPRPAIRQRLYAVRQ